MSNLIHKVLNSDEKNKLREFTSLLRKSQERHLLSNDIFIAFYKYCKSKDLNLDLHQNSNLGQLIYFTQEIILDKESLYLVIRPQMGTQEAYRLSEDMTVDSVNIDELLNLRDKLVGFYYSQDGEVLKIDIQSFDNCSSSLPESNKIGNGIDSLNHYLSSKLFDERCNTWQEALFNFMHLHKYNGQQLLINERIKNYSQLSEKVKRVLNLLENYPPHTTYEDFRFELRSFGFEPGWGNTARRARETLLLLDELIDSGDYQVLKNLISRIPMVFKILVTSLHGGFSKESLLGEQAVNIVEQVNKLEQQIQENAKLAGLNVLGVIEPKIVVLTALIANSEGNNINPSLEKIDGTNNCWILRVPLGESQRGVSQNWISPFEIYPHLQTSASNSEQEVLVEF